MLELTQSDRMYIVQFTKNNNNYKIHVQSVEIVDDTINANI